MSEALREFGPAIWVADGRDVSFFGNRLHHLFLAEWKSAYPKARLYASPSLRKKRKDLAFDAELSDRSDPERATDIDQVAVRGSPLTEIEFFHRASRTAIFADLIRNLPSDWFKGWAWCRCTARRHLRSESRRSTRIARELPQSPRGACRSANHSGLADRSGVDRPWRAGDRRWRNVRAPSVRVATRKRTAPRIGPLR